MDAVLPVLISRAEATRDTEAARAQQAAMAVRQAHDTLRRLGEFRDELIGRSAAATLGRTDTDALAGYQVFMTRLGDAMSQQTREATRREQALASQQARLVEAQQRVLALQTLVRRRAATRDAKQARIEQRNTDDFAARAFARAAQER